MVWQIISRELAGPAAFWQKLKGKTIAEVARQDSAYIRMHFTDGTAVDFRSNFGKNSQNNYIEQCELIKKVPLNAKTSFNFVATYQPSTHGRLTQFFNDFFTEFVKSIENYGPTGLNYVLQDWQELRTQVMSLANALESQWITPTTFTLEWDWRDANGWNSDNFCVPEAMRERIQFMQTEKLACEVFYLENSTTAHQQIYFRIYPVTD